VPERVLARVVALGLLQLAAESQQGLESGPSDAGDEDGGDSYRPPFGTAVAMEQGMKMPGRAATCPSRRHHGCSAPARAPRSR
jgi:hypothetical protein